MATLQIALVIAATVAAAACSLDVAAGHAAAGPDGPQHDEWKAGKAAEKEEAGAAAARQKKMGAVDKVVMLLDGVRAQILQEGEDEAHTYDQFACFCKDTTTETSNSMELGEDQQQGILADIAELSTVRGEFDVHIKELLKQIADAEKEIQKAEAQRKAERKVHEDNSADLLASLELLEAAIRTLTTSKREVGSFVQVRAVAVTLHKALSLADALGLATAAHASKMVTVLLQQDPGVPMQDYDFHSDSVIEMLGKLKEDFHATRAEVDQREVDAQHAFSAMVQELKSSITAWTGELDQVRGRKDGVATKIQAANQDLSAVSAKLLADQEYMTELAKTCHDNAITWDQRTKMRADELATLTSAIAIVKGEVSERTTAATARFLQKKADVSVAQITAGDEDMMEALEAHAEAVDESPDSFIQVATAPRRLVVAFMQKRSGRPASAKQAVVDALRTEGTKIKSLFLLRLASQVEVDPFAKVRKLIQELIERLLAEASAETSQKGWCDKAISDAEVKRKYAAKDIADFNNEIATLEALREKLMEEIAVINEEVAELTAARTTTKKLRAAEAAENSHTIEDAEFGSGAIQQAIDIISRFYKTAAKAAVTVAAAPAPAPAAMMVQAPNLEVMKVPDPGFKAFDAYQGSQGSATGILGMMEVINSDFERTVRLTEEEEARAKKLFVEFMTEAGKALAEKKETLAYKNGYLDDTKVNLPPAKERLVLRSGILQKAIIELIELQKPCVNTSMSYDERVAMREAEIHGMNKALCILENFEEYGADGSGGSC